MRYVPAAAVAAVAAAAALAACQSTATTTAPVKGTEYFSGRIEGPAADANSATYPLTWSGLVKATGKFDTGSSAPAKGQVHTFDTSAGQLVAKISKKPVNSTTTVDALTCAVRSVTIVYFTVNGKKSTGRFAGATGTGKVVAESSGDMPKLPGGKCNETPSAQPVSSTAASTFTGTATLTLKK